MIIKSHSFKFNATVSNTTSKNANWTINICRNIETSIAKTNFLFVRGLFLKTDLVSDLQFNTWNNSKSTIVENAAVLALSKSGKNIVNTDNTAIVATIAVAAMNNNSLE